MSEYLPSSFSNMDIDPLIIEGLNYCKYDKPTLIQKKVLPYALKGRDVVVMARTGSGKTASFLIPLFNKLKKHSDEGIRGLIVLPTKDLSIQTFKFFKDIGRFIDLTCALIIGGESIADQFLAIHQKPDILIGTPGRLLHILSEMSLKLPKIEFVVFDEADRLYEMGFIEDLRAILKITPSSRQIMLISATLPKSLLKFSMLGLQNPEFVRLDMDIKLSDKLKMCNLYIKKEYKISLLVHLLRDVIPETQQTLVFAPTRFHVDWIREVLELVSIQSSVAYSKMDEESRRINISQFRNKITNVLVSTDIASRGIDIPLLDNVINFNFPTTERLFIHRVGRAARAGKEGCAYSFVCLDELPYLFDFFDFLGKEINCLPQVDTEDKNYDSILGSVPQSILDEFNELLKVQAGGVTDKHCEVIINAEKKLKAFVKKPTNEGIKNSKKVNICALPFHPILKITSSDLVSKTFQAYSQSNLKRSKGIDSNLDKVIQARDNMGLKIRDKASRIKPQIRQPKRINLSEFANSEKSNKFKDTFSIPYRPSDDLTERGFSMTEMPVKQSTLEFDILQDDPDEQKQLSSSKPVKTWDRKRKRYVCEDPNEEIRKRKIKTESGTIIKSSYNTNHYQKWLKNSGVGNVLDSKDPKKINQIAQLSKNKKFSSFQNKDQNRSKNNSSKDQRRSNNNNNKDQRRSNNNNSKDQRRSNNNSNKSFKTKPTKKTGKKKNTKRHHKR